LAGVQIIRLADLARVGNGAHPGTRQRDVKDPPAPAAPVNDVSGFDIEPGDGLDSGAAGGRAPVHPPTGTEPDSHRHASQGITGSVPHASIVTAISRLRLGVIMRVVLPE